MTEALQKVAADICAILDMHSGDDGDGLVYDHEAIGEEAARLHEKLTVALLLADTLDEEPAYAIGKMISRITELAPSAGLHVGITIKSRGEVA